MCAFLWRADADRVDHPRFDSGTRKWREEISQAVQQVAEIARVEWIDFYAPPGAAPRLVARRGASRCPRCRSFG